jgi:hypothetical protein
MSARAHASLEPAGAAEERYGSQVFDMRWLMEFYHERRGILARYGIEAPLPGAAVVLGRRALLAEHPPIPTRGRPSLFKQAQGVEGQDPSGWILYRIVRTTSPASAQDDPHAVTGTVIGELNTEVAVE